MQTPDVVIVGAATRDLNDDAPRGWLLGGGVTYGALALARLGLRVGVLLGLDDEAGTASELDLIRDAGAEIVPVRLRKGPVFRNVETLAGRIQTCEGPSDPVPVAALPERWRDVRTWVLAPVASEIRGGMGGARQPPTPGSPSPGRASCATSNRGSAFGRSIPGHQRWSGGRTWWPSAGTTSRGTCRVRDIGQWLPASGELLLTAGLLGGLLCRFEDHELVAVRAYPSVPSPIEIDATGAGDTMLAGLVAARVAAGGEGQRLGRDLHLGALAASLLVEGPGMDSVPTLAQLRQRLARDGC